MTPAIPVLLRQREVLAILRVSRPTLWEWRSKGLFPAPIKLGPNTIAWREADVRAWLAKRPAA